MKCNAQTVGESSQQGLKKMFKEELREQPQKLGKYGKYTEVRSIQLH